MKNLVKYYCQVILKLTSRFKLKHLCVLIGLILFLDLSGTLTHLFEITYDESFIYPYEGNLQPIITALRHNEKPDVPPINEYNYTYIYNPKDKCVNIDHRTLQIVFLVKSALGHFDRRAAIRNSWGFENRFSDVPSKIVFLLGSHLNDEESQAKVNFEAIKHGDIIQADFTDVYYNNTIKTMMGFKWAVNHCINSQFYMFIDDDIYVSVKNVLRFVRNPANYPDYLRNVEQLVKSKREIRGTNMPTLKNVDKVSAEQSATRRKRQVFDFELPDDVRLFAGFVFISSPHRHKTSKWYVPLKEYPYHLWPPYVTAGAYIVSKEALLDMYYTSLYTKHFRFDDIFLGIVAKKAEIEPFHCEEFHFYKKDYTKYNYKYVITSHGYSDPQELLQVWNEQKSLGNA